MKSVFKNNPRLHLRQRGMATILFIILAGMALTVTAMGVMYSVRTSQEQQVTVHATTHSQAGVWAAAEAVRSYLEKLDVDGVKDLETASTLSFDINTNKATAKLSSFPVSGTPPNYLYAEVSYTDLAVKSTSTLEVVYNLKLLGSEDEDDIKDGSGDGVGGVAGMTISGKVDISGNINILGSENFTLNVDNDIKIEKVSVTGLKNINALGNIEIGSNVKVNQLYSNEKIILNGSAEVTTAYALKNIEIKSGGNQGALSSNKNIIIENGSVEIAEALGYIKATSGGKHGSFTAQEYIKINNGSLENANSAGNITIDTWQKVNNSISMEKVTCTSKYWDNFDSIQAKSVNTCPTRSKIITSEIPPIVTLMSKLKEFEITKPKVDAYELKDNANYVFTRDGKVSVKNINNIPDGSYYMGRYDNSHRDYLCTKISSKGICSAPSSYTDAKKICKGYSDNNSCFKYEDEEWKFEGETLTPGIMWFDGDLEFKNGNYYNTFIATGDIETEGDTSITAVNYAGYNTVCKNTDFKDLYPTNLCNKETASMKKNSTGNVALLSGGYKNGQFAGGEIELEGSTEIFGTVIAGDELEVEGNTIIHGYITVAGQGDDSETELEKSLTIDLRNLPSGYNPGDLPPYGGGGDEDGDGDGDGISKATILWSRYL